MRLPLQLDPVDEDSSVNLSMGESASAKSRKQPTLHPTDKVVGVEHGGVLGLLIVGFLLQIGIEPNALLASGIGGASAWLVGYLTKERSKV